MLGLGKVVLGLDGGLVTAVQFFTGFAAAASLSAEEQPETIHFSVCAFEIPSLN